MKCKGIWAEKSCPNNADATGGREYCEDCWNIGEDLMLEQEMEQSAIESDQNPESSTIGCCDEF